MEIVFALGEFFHENGAALLVQCAFFSVEIFLPEGIYSLFGAAVEFEGPVVGVADVGVLF